MGLQTSLEQRDQYIAVLYCVIGVLVVFDSDRPARGRQAHQVLTDFGVLWVPEAAKRPLKNS